LVWDLATKDEISLICKAKKTGILALGRDYAAYSASYGSSCQISVSGSKGRPYCTATFATDKSNGGATPAPTPTTYKVGDTYKDSEGNIIGTVVEVDSSKQHGTIAITEGKGSSDDAGIKCVQKTTGGKAWMLASGAHACTLLKTAGSCEGEHCSMNLDVSSIKATCGLHAKEGQGRCRNSKWYRAISSQTLTSCAVSDSLFYVCTTTF